MKANHNHARLLGRMPGLADDELPAVEGAGLSPSPAISVRCIVSCAASFFSETAPEGLPGPLFMPRRGTARERPAPPFPQLIPQRTDFKYISHLFNFFSLNIFSAISLK